MFVGPTPHSRQILAANNTDSKLPRYAQKRLRLAKVSGYPRINKDRNNMNVHNISFTSLPPAGDENTVQVNVRRSSAKKNAPWNTITIETLDDVRNVIQALIDKCSTIPTRTLQLTDEVLGPRPVDIDELVRMIEDTSVLNDGTLNQLDVIVYDHDPTPRSEPETSGRQAGLAPKEKNGCCVTM